MKNLLFITFVMSMISLPWACYHDDFGSKDSNQSNSQVGSYSTMLTIGNNLYLVNATSISTYNISNASNPVLLNKQEVGFDIESLYHHEGLLLIGSALDMFIFSLDSRGVPVREASEAYFGTFDNSHCVHDPIVARGSHAYVTLSTELEICWWRVGINELRVYDISDLENVSHLNTNNLSNPKGLALGKEKLFVCDAVDGLYVFDLSDPEKPQLDQLLEGFSAFDALVRNHLLIVVARDRLLQFDISDENNILLISEFELG